LPKESREESRAEALVDSKTNPAAASAKRIKRVDSGEEVLQARNVPSSANDHRDSGIVIRIKSLQSVGYLPAVLPHPRRKSWSRSATRPT
jgi:hypothetical protein